MTIFFFHPHDDFGFLSNFSNHGFTLENNYWPTVEHYYQAMKFNSDEMIEKIRECPSPKKAKKMAHDHHDLTRNDWDHVKVPVMKKALIQKFITHKNIQKSLIDTNNVDLVEDSKKDFFWGRGWDGSGKNMLGNLLMEIRAMFVNPEQ